MKFKALSIIFFFSVLSISNAEKADNKFSVSLSYERSQASSWYDYETEQVESELTDFSEYARIDSSKKDNDGNVLYDTTFRDYTSDFYRSTIKFGFSWQPVEKIRLNATVPLSFFKEVEEYDQLVLYDDTGMNPIIVGGEPKEKNNRTRIDYIGLSAETFAIKNKKVALGGLFEVRIPTGGDNSVLDNPEGEFLSDGYFAANAGLISEFYGKITSFRTMVVYNYRGEEFSDRLIFQARASFSTVQNTAFRILVNYAHSIEEYKEEFRFAPKKEELWSHRLELGVDFKIDIFEHYSANAGYLLNMWGLNGRSTGMYFMQVAYLF